MDAHHRQGRGIPRRPSTGRIEAMIVFGTRPEVIKLAPVAHALAANDAFHLTLVSSDQHRDMIAPVCKLFDLRIDHHLDVMKPGQSLAYLTSAVTQGMNELLERSKPDVVIVQGDTTTAFAGALSAFYHKIPIAHVEAGMRTGDLYSPWPEEANRILISRLAAYHYPPTAGAAGNLRAEGIPDDAIVTTGNTVIDAARHIGKQQFGKETRAAMAAELGITPGQFILFTMHRRESFGGGVERVFKALDLFARQHKIDVIFPVHPNPNVAGPAHAFLGQNPHIRLIAPLDYERMVFALANCKFLITDSGGLVEEAPTFCKPVLVLRETTERRESVDAGGAILVGTDTEKLTRLAAELTETGPLHEQMSRAPNPFGDGRASLRIADHLAAALGAKAREARKNYEAARVLTQGTASDLGSDIDNRGYQWVA
jgi:UDP-N-acetylglucosamine 2-epimerase (non-hydrolysing)